MENRQIQQMKELETLFEKYVKLQVTISITIQVYCLVNKLMNMYATITFFSNFRETKTMKETQAKTSVETAREVNNDKSLKSKAEKERILREKNSNMTK